MCDVCLEKHTDAKPAYRSTYSVACVLEPTVLAANSATLVSVQLPRTQQEHSTVAVELLNLTMLILGCAALPAVCAPTTGPCRIAVVNSTDEPIEMLANFLIASVSPVQPAEIPARTVVIAPRLSHKAKLRKVLHELKVDSLTDTASHDAVRASSLSQPNAPAPVDNASNSLDQSHRDAQSQDREIGRIMNAQLFEDDEWSPPPAPQTPLLSLDLTPPPNLQSLLNVQPRDVQLARRNRRPPARYASTQVSDSASLLDFQLLQPSRAPSPVLPQSHMASQYRPPTAIPSLLSDRVYSPAAPQSQIVSQPRSLPASKQPQPSSGSTPAAPRTIYASKVRRKLVYQLSDLCGVLLPVVPQPQTASQNTAPPAPASPTALPRKPLVQPELNAARKRTKLPAANWNVC